MSKESMWNHIFQKLMKCPDSDFHGSSWNRLYSLARLCTLAQVDLLDFNT